MDVLVVAPDQGIRDTLTMILNEKGFKAGSAGTIKEAISALLVHQPQLMILDPFSADHLDDQSKYCIEAARRCAVSVFIMSGTTHRQETTLRQAIRAVSTSFLRPFEIEDFLGVMRQITRLLSSNRFCR